MSTSSPDSLRNLANGSKIYVDFGFEDKTSPVNDDPDLNINQE